jgi:hypothetical protein
VPWGAAAHAEAAGMRADVVKGDGAEVAGSGQGATVPVVLQ